MRAAVRRIRAGGVRRLLRGLGVWGGFLLVLGVRGADAEVYHPVYFDSVVGRFVTSPARWEIDPAGTFRWPDLPGVPGGRWDTSRRQFRLYLPGHPARDFRLVRWDGGQLVLQRRDGKVLAFHTEALTISALERVLRGGLGLVILLFLTWLFSIERRAIPWRIVLWGMGLQIVLASSLLYLPGLREVFQGVSWLFVRTLSFSQEGARFLFGSLAESGGSLGFLFAFQVLPTIVFFSALSGLLYHFKVLPWLIRGFSWLMRRTMRITGVESLATAANIFIGQTEAPLLIRPYLMRMSRSELHALMSGGMATIAGGVLASYVVFLGGASPHQQWLFATHLLIASIISAPAALVAAKLIVPPEALGRSESGKLAPSPASNFLDALVVGTRDGLKLAVNVAAMLLVFIALVAMVNAVLPRLGEATGLSRLIERLSGGIYHALTLQSILAVFFAPLSWVMGTPASDIFQVGQLLGEKTVLNEFYAYLSLAEMKDSGLLTHPRSILIATYALCGFANFASIGIQVGGIGSLIPSRQGELARLGFRAMVAGTFASFYTATVIAMIT